MTNAQTLNKMKPARSALPYVVPMAVFLVLTSVEASAAAHLRTDPKVGYVIVYALKLAATGAAVWWGRSTWQDLKPWPGALTAVFSALLGLIVTAIWVGLDRQYPTIPLLGTRSGFDPSTLPAGISAAFIAIRLLGLVVIVPIVEELFWRSFLMRWVIDPDFFQVPVGRVTPLAAGATSVLFALAHPEWLPALITGLLWAGLLWRTRNLVSCVISHSMANLALGLYVLSTGAWRFW